MPIDDNTALAFAAFDAAVAETFERWSLLLSLPKQEKPIMPDAKLSTMQLQWLCGLHLAERYVLMSATEIGDPQVSMLMTLGLVDITRCLDGFNWRITDAGRQLFDRHYRNPDGTLASLYGANKPV